MTYTLHLGDCLEYMKGMAAGSVDAVVTDPPYGIDYQSARRTDRAQWKPKIANDKTPFTAWLPQAFLAGRDGSATLCFCRWDVEAVFATEMGAAGYTVKSQVIWDKVVHGMGDLNGAFAPCHENILYATKGDYKWWGDRPRDVFRVQRIDPERLVHPNEKPVGLLKMLIESCVAPGGTIFDPFMGSGTTGVACMQLGRNFIGCEIDPTYFAIAEKRIAAAVQQTRMEGM